MLWRMYFPQWARVHTCFPSHMQGLDRAHTCFPSTTWVEELLHQVSEAWGGVCMQICATIGGDYAVICGTAGRLTLQIREELLHKTRVRGGVCMQIHATRGGDYAVMHGMRYPTLQGGVRTGACDGVASCWMETEGKGTTETVFEEHLEAGTENALLFQFQGSQDEICGGGGCGDFKSLVCPLADGEGVCWVSCPCSEGSVFGFKGGWVGMVGLGS